MSAASRTADAVSGMVAGTAGAVLGHPIDTVRVNVITSGRSAVDIARVILAKQGVNGFFRGIVPPFSTNGIIGTVVFSVFESAKRVFRPHVESGSVPEWMGLAAAGGCAGLASSLVSTPPQVVKVQMQTSLQHNVARTASSVGSAAAGTLRGRAGGAGGAVQATLAAAARLVKARGVLGLYRGYSAQVSCEVAGRMTYYLTYETAKAALLSLRTGAGPDPRRHALEPVRGVWLGERMAAGALAGCVGWTVTFPMDVARNRMQAQPPDSTKYTGVLQCLRRCVAEEGVGVLYRGLGVTLLRAAPVAMTVLPTFDLVRDAIATYLHV